jgi:hypothetical protein
MPAGLRNIDLRSVLVSGGFDQYGSGNLPLWVQTLTSRTRLLPQRHERASGYFLTVNFYLSWI